MDLSKHQVHKLPHPTPDDFDNYLPWACNQLSVEVMIDITKTFLGEYISISDRTKKKGSAKSKSPSVIETEDIYNKDSSSLSFLGIERKIHIVTVYDKYNNLVKLKFLNNKGIPQRIMKIIGLIIPFHKHLTSITINSGLRVEGIYEISKYLPISRITEIIFDHTFLIEANYHVLLNVNSLKHLSLAKCKINDVVVKNIASKLAHPKPASQKLSALNLATNRITDIGVKYLAEALRSNRQLSYLNLADNMISDTGALSLFDILDKFPLTIEEIRSARMKYIAYFKEKVDIVHKIVKDLRAGDSDKKNPKKKSVKPVTVTSSKKKIVEQESSELKTKTMLNPDAGFYERAEAIVEGMLEPFYYPFDKNNIEIKDQTVYCNGNNALCYLNLAYNDLTLVSLRKLNHVLITQKLLRGTPKGKVKSPKGLINVIIEGNFLPEHCEELLQIDELLATSLTTYRRMSFSNRGPSPRSSTKSN